MALLNIPKNSKTANPAPKCRISGLPSPHEMAGLERPGAAFEIWRRVVCFKFGYRQLAAANPVKARLIRNHRLSAPFLTAHPQPTRRSTVAYRPGLAMRHIADPHLGEAKTNSRDAYIIAHAARIMPEALRDVQVPDKQVSELSMLCGFDADLAKQATATSNRIRGLLTQIHPALERVIGKHLNHMAMAELLAKYPTPAALRKAGEARIGAQLRKHAPRAWKKWAKAIIEALGEQTVVVSGTERAALVLPALARALSQTRITRADILIRVEKLVKDHPLHLILDSMPGVGIRTQSRILTEIAGKDFASPGHLASYAGLAPAT